jgi:hypothetical protein
MQTSSGARGRLPAGSGEVVFLARVERPADGLAAGFPRCRRSAGASLSPLRRPTKRREPFGGELARDRRADEIAGADDCCVAFRAAILD